MREQSRVSSGPDMSVPALTDRLRAILGKPPAVDPSLVEDVVQAVLNTIGSRLSITETQLLVEIAELGRIIASAKADVAEINAGEITGQHLPTATDELDAIVEHTARSTDSILECCEELDRLGELLGGIPGAQLAVVTSKIYEACSFQDIVGQRITKIVKALKHIEAKVQQMSSSIEAGSIAASHGAARPNAVAGDDALLNGPQATGVALVQSDIDDLLADF
jgi:chemotaxis protein CheZ